MNWEAIGVTATVSIGVSTLMGFVFSLMIRSAIAEMAQKITAEMHSLLGEKYVLKELHDRDVRELKQGIEWLEGLIGGKG